MSGAAPDELNVIDYIAQTRASYDKLGYDAYRWAAEPEPSALVAPLKPLSESKVALVASGGIYEVGQAAFHHRDDTSIRRVSTDVEISDLRISHFAYDRTDARSDPNVVFPIDPLRDLVATGKIGSLTSHALTFMGGIYSQRRLREELIPELSSELSAMAPDVVLLVPV